MKKIIILWIICSLSLPACARLREECRTEKTRVDRVATLAKDLQRGMAPNEVRASLGDPDDINHYPGEGAPEAWKYRVLEDCKIHQGISAPTTELVFVYGKLARWLTYGR